MIGNKYGPVPLPSHIEESEFQQIRDEAFEAGKGMNIIGLISLKDAASPKSGGHNLGSHLPL